MSSALETRVNSSVMERLTNAQGLLANGEQITLIYDRPFAEWLGGQVDGAGPVCHAYDADITTHTIGSGTLIMINGAPLKVRNLHPDGTGLTALLLEEA